MLDWTRIYIHKTVIKPLVLDWTRLHSHRTVIMPLVLDGTRIYGQEVAEKCLFACATELDLFHWMARLRGSTRIWRWHYTVWWTPTRKKGTLLALREILSLVLSISTFFHAPYNSDGNAHQSFNYCQHFSNLLITCPFLTSRCFSHEQTCYRRVHSRGATGTCSGFLSSLS